MPVTKIQFKPGVIRDVTSYTNEGGWYYSNKIRFRGGSPESIGGWVKATSNSYVGTCTAIMPWASLGGVNYTAVGTNLKYYVEYGSVLTDITPIRKTTNPLGNNPITTAGSSAVLVIADTAHGAGLRDYVTISGATGPINGVPVAEINVEHSITRVVDANSYEVTVTTAASGAGSGGGAAVVAAYQINVGLSIYVPGVGWSAGAFGSGLWSGAAGLGVSGQIRLWTQGTFGEDLVFCDRNGGIYYWDTSVGVGTRAVYLKDMAGAFDVPTIATAVLITDSRHVVALGANPIGSANQDPLMVRWSDTEDAVVWTPTALNTAGGYRLTLGNAIQTAHNVRLETLIWTDTALYSMAFIGGDLEFGFNLLGSPISIIGPNAAVAVGGTAFWMGTDKFYTYNGTVNTLPCPLLKILQTNLNHDQTYQVFAGTNELHTEVTWFYPSTNSNTVDSYITFNYMDNIWYFGTLNRSAWADSGHLTFPLAADNVNNVLLSHEVGVDDVSTGTPVAINSFIESADIDLGDGHQFMFIGKIIPDISFEGSTAANPSVSLTVKTRNTPGNDWISSTNQPSTSSVTRTANGTIYTSPVEQHTPQLWVRLRGRQASIRIENTAVGVRWQLGALRLDVRPDGRR